MANTKTKQLVVRWTACYETVITVPHDASETDIKDEAANIPIDVVGSEYQTDTWEVDSITPVTKEVEPAIPHLDPHTTAGGTD